MDFSTEGLRRQAMAMFATLQILRRTLPVKLTPELNEQGDKVAGPGIQAVRANPVFRQWVKETIAYNKKNTQSPLAIVLYIIPSQCMDNKLRDMETLSSQMMWTPIEGLGKVNVPDSHLPNVVSVVVRVEVFLTQEEDTKRTDLRVLDPDGQLPITDEDWPVVRARLHRETGMTVEALEAMANIVRRNPEAALEVVAPDVDLRKAINLETKVMRSCGKCQKYGYRLGKCGGCKEIYYCSAECQTSDWKEHLVKCKKEKA